MNRLRLLCSAALLLTVLAGCGKSPTAALRPAVNRRPLQGAPLNQFAGAPVPGADGGEGAHLLATVRQVLGNAKGFEGELTAKTEGHWKQGEKVSELRHVSVSYRITWVKPNKFRAEVFNSGSAIMDGAQLVTTDGQNLTARCKGLLGFVPISLTATEPKLGNARNHLFKQFNPTTQIQRLTGPTAIWNVVDRGPGPGGTQIVYVAVDGVAHLDREIDREVMGLDPASGVLRTLTSFAAGHKVVDYNFKRFSWNPRVTAETFKL